MWDKIDELTRPDVVDKYSITAVVLGQTVRGDSLGFQSAGSGLITEGKDPQKVKMYEECIGASRMMHIEWISDYMDAVANFKRCRNIGWDPAAVVKRWKPTAAKRLSSQPEEEPPSRKAKAKSSCEAPIVLLPHECPHVYDL